MIVIFCPTSTANPTCNEGGISKSPFSANNPLYLLNSVIHIGVVPVIPNLTLGISSASIPSLTPKPHDSEEPRFVSAKGLNCPLPILKAKKAINDVASGGTLEVLATDPGSVADFEAFCRTTGNELLESSEDGGVYTYVIKKTA